MRCSCLLRSSIKQVQQLIKHEQTIVEKDIFTLRVSAGSGGNGLSRYDGRGGNGGSVYLTASTSMAFTDIKKKLGGKMKLKAQNGTHSQKIKLVGDDGEHTYLQVPVGVEAVDTERNVLLARCSRPYQRYLIARGGTGGNARNHYKGEPGEQFDVSLHLKLRPNVGLVGFPNAGKSTLMKAFVPRKSIKIAPYPFTTTKPQVAFWVAEKHKEEEEDFTLSIADLPGLIEGAAQNRGKGHKFLKHLEYADVLLLVVDCLGFQLSNNLNEPFRTPLEVVALLNRELEDYSKKLVEKPALLVLNKIDIAPDKEEPSRLAQVLRGFDWPLNLSDELRPRFPLQFDFVLPISAKLGEIEELKRALVRTYRNVRPSIVPEHLRESDDKSLL
ncbi:hypothetical protein RB195_000701 [Necator americanus]|nr:Obg family GTPase CgtA [Necator americanus]ETN68819.1 Obg family GTPase CgtA [Necator americanus]